MTSLWGAPSPSQRHHHSQVWQNGSTKVVMLNSLNVKDLKNSSATDSLEHFLSNLIREPTAKIWINLALSVKVFFC